MPKARYYTINCLVRSETNEDRTENIFLSVPENEAVEGFARCMRMFEHIIILVKIYPAQGKEPINLIQRKS